MSELLRFDGGCDRDPGIADWFAARSDELGALALQWFSVMRGCGDDVREVLHDGHPTVLVEDAAFAYVNAFTAHVNVGFFRGAELEDPAGILEGNGVFMRHVKLRPTQSVDESAVTRLIEAAHADIVARLSAS